MSQITQVSGIVFVIVFVYVIVFVFFCQAMFPHHSDQMSQSSQVSRVAPWRCSLNVFVFVIVFAFVFVFVIVFLFGQAMSSYISDQMFQRS